MEPRMTLPKMMHLKQRSLSWMIILMMTRQKNKKAAVDKIYSKVRSPSGLMVNKKLD